MKKKRFSVEQITTVLQQAAARVPVGDVCRQVGISEQTFTGGRSRMAACCPAKRASSSSCVTRMTLVPTRDRSD